MRPSDDQGAQRICHCYRVIHGKAAEGVILPHLLNVMLDVSWYIVDKSICAQEFMIIYQGLFSDS